MADAAITRTTPGRTEIQHQINWGAVVKGAAIIVGVAVVAFAAYSGVNWFLATPHSGLLGTISTEAAKFLAGAGDFITGPVWDGIQATAGFIWNGLGGIFSSMFPGSGTAAAIAQSSSVEVAKNAGLVAAVGTTAVVAQKTGLFAQLWDSATHIFQPTQVTIPAQTMVEPALFSQNKAASLAAHDTTSALASAKAKHELTRQLTDIPDELMNVDERRQQRNWAERDGIRRERRDVAPRQSSQIAALADDRANASLLSDPVR